MNPIKFLNKNPKSHDGELGQWDALLEDQSLLTQTLRHRAHPVV